MDLAKKDADMAGKKGGAYPKVNWTMDSLGYFMNTLRLHLVAGMIAGIVAFTRKDSLYPARRLPNANLF